MNHKSEGVALGYDRFAFQAMTSDFRSPTSDRRLPIADLRSLTSDLRLLNPSGHHPNRELPLPTLGCD